jgi:hypothetical protein
MLRYNYFVIPFAFAVLLVYFLASPYVTYYRMAYSIYREDPDSLSKHIDYQQLRENIKGRISSKGDSFPRSILVGVVDRYLNEDGIAMLIGAGTKVPAIRDSRDEMNYNGLMGFVVSISNKGRKTNLVFERRYGFSWYLVDVELV